MSTGKGHLTYWCFSLDQLERALAAYTERRMNEGATVAHAKQEAWAIAQFLLSPEARAAKMIAGGDEANRG